MTRRVLAHLSRVLIAAIVAAMVLGSSSSVASASSPFGFIQTPFTGTPNVWDVCYGADRFIAVGGGGIALTSTDGRSWTEVPLPAGSDLMSIAYGAGRFVAVGYYGTILSSADGLTWKDRGPGGDIAVLAVTYTGSRFVAVGTQGFVATSSDGVEWDSGVVGENQLFVDVAYGNGKIVAITALGRVYSSADGESWEGKEWPDTITSWVTFASGRFLVHRVSVLGGYEILSSTDGKNWTSISSSKEPRYVEVPAIGPDRMIALGQLGATWLSKDSGVTWAAGGRAAFNARRIAYGAGLFVVVGEDGLIQVSSDGITWEKTEGPRSTKVAFQAMAAGNGVFVVAGYDLHSYADKAMVSKNGLVWEQVYTGGIAGCQGVAFGGGIFLLVGLHGQTACSSDGYTWNRVVWPTFPRLTSVAYGNGTFVAVGENGVIGTTVNGVDATLRESGTTSSLWSVDFLDGQFVAVGSNGTLLTSPDGVTWTAKKTDTTEQLTDIAYGADQYIVTGGNGLILTSPDLVTWIQRNAHTEEFLTSVVYAGGVFIVVESDYLFASPDGVDWQTDTVSYVGGAVDAFCDGKWLYVFGGNGLMATTGLANPVAVPGKVTGAEIALTLQIGSDTLGIYSRYGSSSRKLDAVPIVVNDKTFLPVRAVVEALGATVSWDEAEQRVDIVKGFHKISLWIGRSEAVVDAVTVPIDPNPDVKPYLAESGPTMLPLRFIVERLGAVLEWNPVNSSMIITLQ